MKKTKKIIRHEVLQRLSAVVENCTNSVPIHGRPFSILEDGAFKNILSMIKDLKTPDLASINKTSIKKNKKEKAVNLRFKIFEEV